MLFLSLLSITLGFALQTVYVSTLVALFGPQLALRGPDGSLHDAVEGSACSRALAHQPCEPPAHSARPKRPCHRPRHASASVDVCVCGARAPHTHTSTDEDCLLSTSPSPRDS